MKILFIFGTRPEAIKMAPLVLELKKYNTFEVKVAVTAQHREMLDAVLDFFNIKPDYDLNIMKPNQDLYGITVNALLGLKEVVKAYMPDLILVHGDTTTTFVGALAGFYEHVSIGHVEAGLRTFNKYAPFPEEMNRKLTTALADYFFVPTKTAYNNLRKENVDKAKIFITGNTVIDALLYAKNTIENNLEVRNQIKSNLSDKGLNEKVIDSLESAAKMILITGHRRENFGEGFLNICYALRDIAVENPNVKLIYPVHLNPNVRKPVFEILNNVENIFLIEPVDYVEFVYLMMKSYFIITDSGGVQEEAPSLGKPILVMRELTERPEAVRAGTVKLVGTDRKRILKLSNKLLMNKRFYKNMSRAINPYGDGMAAERIRTIIAKNR